jgi:hypothetical protein
MDRETVLWINEPLLDVRGAHPYGRAFEMMATAALNPFDFSSIIARTSLADFAGR